MRRREFITLVGGAAAGYSALASEASGQRGDSNVRAASAQQGAKTPRIGIVVTGHSVGPDASRVTLDAFVSGLRELGYTEGQNITIERGFGESNADRLREVAAGLVQRQVDVIVALSTTAARPVKQATSVIPIVAFGMADPVEDELVASLGRPGGNWDDLSWSGAGRQAAAIAQRGGAATLSRGGPLAPTRIWRSHDGRDVQGGRARSPDIGHAPSIRAGSQPR